MKGSIRPAVLFASRSARAILAASFTFLVGSGLGGTPGIGPLSPPLEIGVFAPNVAVSLSITSFTELDLFVANHSDAATLAVRVDAECVFADGSRQSILQDIHGQLGPGGGTVLFVTFPLRESTPIGPATLVGTARARILGSHIETLLVRDTARFEIIP